MESLIIVIHILAAVAIVGLVLIQQGKGADMGASFGSGASQTIFGSSGSGNVLTASTTWLAVLFFITSLGLAMVARNRADAGVEVESLLVNPDAATQIAPAISDVPVAVDAATATEQTASDLPVAATVEAAPATAATETANSEIVAESVADETATGDSPVDSADAAVVEPATQTTEN